MLGIGDVLLEVETSHNATGPQSLGTILLKDVLYVPSGAFNIIGRPIIRDYLLVDQPGATYFKLEDKQTGDTAGFLDHRPLARLRLVVHCTTETSVDRNLDSRIGIKWNNVEQAKSGRYKLQGRQALTAISHRRGESFAQAALRESIGFRTINIVGA